MTNPVAHIDAVKLQAPRSAETFTDWIQFLRASLEPDWRSSEWNQSAWFFHGDPEDPHTRIFRCATPTCPLLSSVRDGRCATCYAFLRRHNGDEAQLVESIPKRVNTHRPGDKEQMCLVVSETARCQRTVEYGFLCMTHHQAWRNAAKKKGISTVDWARSGGCAPLPAIGTCSVAMCSRSRGWPGSTLCPAHRVQYLRRVRETPNVVATPLPEERFAATTAPIHARGNFSLIGLPESIRLEVLVSLQIEDRSGYLIDPQGMVRLMPVLAKAKSSLLEPGFEAEMMTFNRANNTARAAMVRRMFVTLNYLRDQYEGVDPTAGDLWDSYLTELQTERQRRNSYEQTKGEQKWLSKRHKIDFTPIQQPWLRELAKHWARDIRPDVTRVRSAILGFSVLSDAVSERPDGADPSTAGPLDIQRTLDLLVRLKNKSGGRYSSNSHSTILTALRRALQYLWGAGHMQGIPPGFVITPEERIRRTKTTRRAKALPNRVVVALVDAIPNLPLAAGQTGSLISAETLLHLHKTALRVLADTGRRPNEVCSLKAGCVVQHAPEFGEESGNFTLTYDNHKAGREGRTIPISEELANLIQDWEAYRQTLTLPDEYDEWLFPSPSAGRRDAFGHLTTMGLSRALNRLVASVPWLESDVPDKKTGGYVRFTGKIIMSSFRHSYAQRHADAGVGVEALAELMDHKSTTTTLTYFEVTEKRKREAAETLAPLAMTRNGAPAPFESAVAYEIAAVAVPFGGCIEPSNVKAGGGACPIRFQCAGCDMYRPDPSYLPAIETHVRSIRASLQMVKIAGTAAPWVIQNMVEEIASYEKIIADMTRRLADFTEEERQAIDDSSAAMRKLREQRPLIPLRVIK